MDGVQARKEAEKRESPNRDRYLGIFAFRKAGSGHSPQEKAGDGNLSRKLLITCQG